jgi:hypothetical protein
VVDPRRGTRDTRLVERALRERWEIPLEAFAELPEALLAVVRGSKSNRERVAAAKALLSAGQHNLAVARLAAEQERLPAPGQVHFHQHQHGSSLTDQAEALIARLRAEGRILPSAPPAPLSDPLPG